MSSYYYICVLRSSYYYVRVLILLYVSSYCYMYVLILVHLQNYRLANKLLGTDVSICYNIRMHTHTLTHALHTNLQHYWLGTKLLGKEVSICYNIRMRCIRIRLRMCCIHLQHYWLGTKLLGKEVSICYNIVKQVYAYACAHALHPHTRSYNIVKQV